MGTVSMITALVGEEEVAPTHTIMPLTRSKVDQLYWLGRYTERVYTTLKVFFEVCDKPKDSFAPSLYAFCKTLDIAYGDNENTDDLMSRVLYDKEDPSSVCASMRAAFSNALVLRPELGTEVTSHIELAFTSLKTTKEPEIRLRGHREVADNLLAFWGSVEDSVESSEVKALLFFGKYVERVELWSRFGMDETTLDRPVRKLIFYLGYIRHPESLGTKAVLTGLIGNLEARGYGEFVINRLRSVCELIGK